MKFEVGDKVEFDTVLGGKPSGVVTRVTDTHVYFTLWHGSKRIYELNNLGSLRKVETTKNSRKKKSDEQEA